ncbi:MAG: cache and HAMP domain-containing protein [Phycisphaerales bacterium]|nr:cache and HAMP domain-containing protein [Phycisphaerales bacterium]
MALIPLGGLSYIGGYQLEQDWRQNTNQNLKLTASALASKVNGWIGMNRHVLRENAQLPDILSMDGARQKPVLKAIQNTYEWAYLVFSVGRDGRSIGRSDDNPPQYYGDRVYFKQVLEGQAIGQQVAIGKTSKKPALILAGPIRIADSNEGVLAMAMQLVDVSQAVTSTTIGTTGFAILVDRDNKVIAHGKSEQIAEELQDLSTHPALQSSESTRDPIIYQEGGKSVVAFAQKIDLGWTLIIQQDYDEAFAPLLQVRQQALFLIAGALILVIIIAYLLSRQLANPITELTAVAEDISRGHFKQKIVGTERRDEIGALARAVERMAASIKLAFERLRKPS